ncbi:hypothetical protein AC578_8157 [Pseudocercospora eumusae]|uniref:Flavin reductase like domain-containing protein n=1 Tax=Pseudocercospora eumusae TaxID=321146 RepID=A0A139HAI2_9PEZI|nr:hypothetical protein AC578_8157 [Pseudocercospora eumusae]
MHRPGVASRRFYRAFYRWSLLNSHTPTSTHARQQALAPRNAPLREEEDGNGNGNGNGGSGNRNKGDQDVPIHFHSHYSGKHLRNRARDATNDKIPRKCPEKFIKDDVYSATAKPFKTLKINEAVVRYRSDLGLMIEYAICSDHLERLLREFGPNLNALSKRHGCRIEVQDLSALIPPADVGGAAEVRTVSVLLSGSFADVGVTYSAIHSRAQDYALRVGSEHVKSVLQRPSHTLRPLEYVLRHKSDAIWTLEMSLLESHFMRFVAAHDITSIAAQYNVSIDVGEPEQRSTSEVSDKMDAARSFVITGLPPDVTNAFCKIKGIVKYANWAREDLPSNGRRDRAVKAVESPKRTISASKPPSSDEPLLVTVEGPRQASIIRNFIGTGFRLEELRRALGLQVLLPRRLRGDIGLFVEGTPAANRVKDKLHDFLQATSSKAGYAEHSVKTISASALAARTSARARSTKEKAKLSEDIRMISRALTHPIVHISAKDPLTEEDGKLSKARGLTVSSFNTITLAPEPIISFNIKVPSRTWDAIYASQKLRVSILTATPRGAAIAHAFTQPYEYPSEPFEKLFKAGIRELNRRGSNLRPPLLLDDHGKAIPANMLAHLLPDKCVEVGDHVVVVAKVQAFGKDSRLTNMMALSYAMRSYRDAGEAIEPAELSWPALRSKYPGHSEAIPQEDGEDELDALSLGSNIGIEDHGRAEGRPLSQSMPPAASFSPPEQDGKVFHKDPLYLALRLASDSSKGREDVDIHEQFEKFSELVGEDSETSKPEREQRTQKGEQQEDDEKRAATARAEEDEDGFGFDRPRHARNDNFGTSKRLYSTSACLPSFNIRRFYSTATSKAKDLSAVLDQTTSQTTLSDYLCLPDDRRPHTPRVRGLIARKSEIDTARTRLASDDSLLEPSEISELENLISTNERIIAKRLAWNATVDLRFMLDKGRYDSWFFSRVGWFESTIEKGQTVLLEEAKVLKRIFEEGKVGRARYDVLAEKLKGDFEVMSTETRRLARVFEENGETGDD